MILGITGGTGCGKTTLLSCIERRGGVVLDCDAVYHRLLRENGELLKTIEDHFPGTVESGVLNRKKLGSLVFSNENALKTLNAITHSAVKEEVLRLLEAQKPSLAAIDAIALFEADLAALCDKTVAVTAPLEMRVKRLMLRDGISEAYARSRIHAQHDESWFRQRVDRVLVNDGTVQEFFQKCEAFLDTLGIL